MIGEIVWRPTETIFSESFIEAIVGLNRIEKDWCVNCLVVYNSDESPEIVPASILYSPGSEGIVFEYVSDYKTCDIDVFPVELIEGFCLLSDIELPEVSDE